MADEKPDTDSLAGRIDTLEEFYEFMLAYAAQGRLGDEEAPGFDLRDYLERADAALDGLAQAAHAAVADFDGADAAEYAEFIKVLVDDAHKARTGITIIKSKAVISSQLIDNLNASIHLRALLTDLFLIDESLKEPGAE